MLLIVSVPPDILDYPTSTDMVVREGSNVTLRCAATGTPEPTVTWRRETGGAIRHEGTYLTPADYPRCTPPPAIVVDRMTLSACLCLCLSISISCHSALLRIKSEVPLPPRDLQVLQPLASFFPVER